MAEEPKRHSRLKTTSADSSPQDEVLKHVGELIKAEVQALQDRMDKAVGNLAVNVVNTSQELEARLDNKFHAQLTEQIGAVQKLLADQLNEVETRLGAQLMGYSQEAAKLAVAQVKALAEKTQADAPKDGASPVPAAGGTPGFLSGITFHDILEAIKLFKAPTPESMVSRQTDLIFRGIGLGVRLQKSGVDAGEFIKDAQDAINSQEQQ